MSRGSAGRFHCFESFKFLEVPNMAAITAKEEANKKGRIDKAADAMKKPEKQAGTLRHISIHPAENGYSVDVDRDLPAEAQKTSDGSPSASMYTPPKAHVFGGKTAKQDLIDHISKHLD
jgi:hypothetical protein